MSDLIILGVSVVSESVTTYNTVAASMFFFWDYILTFNDEVDLIWRSDLNWVTALFYFIRYLAFGIRMTHLFFCTSVFGLLAVSANDCTIWRWFQVLSGQFLFCAVEALLITRVYAFYARNKKLLLVLGFLLTLEFVAMLVLVITSLPLEVAIPTPRALSHIHSAPCVGVFQPKQFSSLWVPPLIMQSFLVILVIVRFCQQYDSQVSRPNLLNIFLRDHIWAFIMIFAVSLWATLAYERTKHLGEVALTWNYTVLGFCGSRLILNLRAAGKRDLSNSSTLDFGTEIKFSSVIGPADRDLSFHETSRTFPDEN